MIKKLYSLHLDELFENKKYFALSLFISVYVFIPLIIVNSSLRELSIILLSFIVLFLISKVSKVIFLLVSIFNLLANSIILHISMHWGNSNLSTRIEVALQSPDHEISEYLSTYLNIIDAFILFYFIFGIYLLYHLFRRYKHTYKILKISSLSLLGLIMLILSSASHIQGVIPYRYVNWIINSNEWRSIVSKRKEYLKKSENQKISYSGENLLYDKIVIIMGESANKNQMGIYGYKNSTTPFLSDLLQQANSFKFDNVIAPTNQTRYSIPIALTDATVEHFYDFITSQSIISDFKEYGYKTYWLSNQYAMGAHDTYVSSIADEADYVKIENYIDDDGKEAGFDMILLDRLNQINIDSNDKELYVFHLLGSHFQYAKRYPSTTALFPNPENIIEEYDNTIFYTDYVINKIYDKFKDTKLLFIYLSDHAEVVNMKKYGHGYSPSYQDEYDIPLIIHSSEYNKKLLKIKDENKKSLFNMESFNHIVKDLAGIDKNTSNISQSSKVLVSDPINIVDYNKINKFK